MGGKPRLAAKFQERFWQNLRTEAGEVATRRVPGIAESTIGRRRRFVLLQLDNPHDVKLYQIIYNEPTRFSVIAEKVSTVRGEGSVEYVMMLTFYELGDDLPVAKDKRDILASYEKSRSVDDLQEALQLSSDA